MVFFELFTWWYSQGWIGVVRKMAERINRTAHIFSVPILLATLFAPWRRIITYPGASMQAHMQAFIDNFLSRFVGFFVRLFVLLAALVSLTVVSVLCLVELVCWPVLPLAPIILFIKGLTS